VAIAISVEGMPSPFQGIEQVFPAMAGISEF
jgi:hypothetical protein